MIDILRGMDPIAQILIILVVGAFFVGLLKFIVNNFFFIICLLMIFLTWFLWPVIIG